MRATAYEYALLRLVPRVERGECLNVGVVLFARQQRFLQLSARFDAARARLLWPQVDGAAVAEHLALLEQIAAGGAAAGPIGALPAQERFRWLTAPRSTIIQPSAVHVGLSSDPAATLVHLRQRLVDLPDPG
jgi:hypothetical protein